MTGSDWFLKNVCIRRMHPLQEVSGENSQKPNAFQFLSQLWHNQQTKNKTFVGKVNIHEAKSVLLYVTVNFVIKLIRMLLTKLK